MSGIFAAAGIASVGAGFAGAEGATVPGGDTEEGIGVSLRCAA